MRLWFELSQMFLNLISGYDFLWMWHTFNWDFYINRISANLLQLKKKEKLPPCLSITTQTLFAQRTRHVIYASGITRWRRKPLEKKEENHQTLLELRDALFVKTSWTFTYNTKFWWEKCGTHTVLIFIVGVQKTFQRSPFGSLLHK